MRLSNLFVVVLAACTTASAQKANPADFGRPATPEDITKLDFSINPVTGAELPPGKGTAKEGAPVFAAKCAVCHGPTGHEGGVLGNPIVGPKGTRGGIQALPFTSTIWDFIDRAMPRFNEGTLTHDQVYGLTAFLLFRAGIINEDEVMDAKSLPKVEMPNRYGFVPSDLKEIGNLEKRGCRLGHCPGPDPVTAKQKDKRGRF
jgi:S-disulfanyl-L-cysteine oxidoreductase SoxD